MTYPSHNRRMGERRKTLRLAPGVIQGPAWEPNGFGYRQPNRLSLLQKFALGVLVLFVASLTVGYLVGVHQ